MSSARRATIGVAIAAAYVAVAVLIPGATSRPLFDIIGPQPYHWVNPPPEFAATNQKAQGGRQAMQLSSKGTDAASVATDDGQASLIFREGAFAPRSGESQVLIEIEALDPATLGLPVPTGLRFDGNAYRFVATYRKSGREATIRQPATIVLTYPLVATKLFRLDATTWTDLKANPVAVQQQIYSSTDRVGTFVAVGPPLTKPPPKGSFPAALVISVGAAAAAVVAGLVARMRARKRKAAAKKPVKRPPPGGRPTRR